MNDLAFFLEAASDANDEPEKLHEAVQVSRQALQIYERAYGPKHPGTLTEMANLSYLLERTGAAAESEKLARMSLTGREEALGEDHRDTLTSVYNLAELLESRGKIDEAEALFRRELTWCSATYGPRAPQTRTSTRNFNQFCQKHKRGAHAPSPRLAASQFNSVR